MRGLGQLLIILHLGIVGLDLRLLGHHVSMVRHLLNLRLVVRFHIATFFREVAGIGRRCTLVSKGLGT